MIELVISGGQTGADQAGWRAAKAAGIKTGGWMPRGFKTEDGNHPEFAEMFGAQEHTSNQYPPRTYANAAMADVTIWFGSGDSAGFGCTVKACRSAGKPFHSVGGGNLLSPMGLANVFGYLRCKSVNIAGNRESSNPGIGEWVEIFLRDAFAANQRA